MDPEPNAVLTSTTPDGITTITINRPHRRNAIDPRTSQKLYDAFIAYEKDDSQKVCVFHGANGNFCAGGDLQEAVKLNEAQGGHGYHSPLGDRSRGPLGPSRLVVRKPVICAVAGHAVAGGLELSLIGDMRIVEEDAVFGVFCRRWGVPLIDGGTVRLPAIIGLGRAMDMVLTGRPVGAQEALSFGLANRIVPNGKAVEVAMEVARQLLTFPNVCMNLDRASCYHAMYDAPSFEAALEFEYSQGERILDGESIAGAARFSSGAGRHGKFDRDSKL